MGRGTRSPKQRIPPTPQNRPWSNKNLFEKRMLCTFQVQLRVTTKFGFREDVGVYESNPVEAASINVSNKKSQ